MQTVRETKNDIGPAFHERPARDPTPLASADERRTRPRSSRLQAASVRGLNSSGEMFEERTQLRGLSGSGASLQVAHRVAVGQEIFIVFVMSSLGSETLGSSQTSGSGGRFATYGTVRHVEELPGGAFRIGIEFHRHRFTSRQT